MRVPILMLIRVLLFGVMKDVVGCSSEEVEIPDGARVADILTLYAKRCPQFDGLVSALAVSVNQEYSPRDRILANGDELGLLPPVSGGGPENGFTEDEISVVDGPIETAAILARAKHRQDGAAVVFEGVVRNNTRGRPTLYLDYEAYQPMALKQMRDLAKQARERFGVNGISIVHRVGRLQIGETSVLIVVASAHRAGAFEACRWIIDALKKTVPIWKKEYFEDGAVWADGEPFPQEIQQRGSTAASRPASN